MRRSMRALGIPLVASLALAALLAVQLTPSRDQVPGTDGPDADKSDEVPASQPLAQAVRQDYSAVTSRSLFEPAGPARPGAPQTQAVEPQDLELIATYSADGTLMAVFLDPAGDERVSGTIGDTVAGHLIAAMTPGTVTLQTADGETRIHLDDEDARRAYLETADPIDDDDIVALVEEIVNEDD